MNHDEAKQVFRMIRDYWPSIWRNPVDKGGWPAAKQRLVGEKLRSFRDLPVERAVAIVKSLGLRHIDDFDPPMGTILARLGEENANYANEARLQAMQAPPPTPEELEERRANIRKIKETMLEAARKVVMDETAPQSTEGPQ